MAATSNDPHPGTKRRILVFCDYYLPSTKGGGGTWTVVNLIERFCDRYDFFVVTRNHESRTDTRPFSTVASNTWNNVGNAKVYYLSPDQITSATLESLVLEISPDGIFLNSVFSKPVVAFLRLRKRRRSINMPVILAPCGELSAGALSLKPWKKRIFLMFARFVGLYSDLTWKATTSAEVDEIRRIVGKKVVTRVAPDLTPRQIFPDLMLSEKLRKEPGSAKFIYYSRIDQKKNLLFFLDLLTRVKSDSSVELTIAGPVDDEEYWKKCQERLNQLPSIVSVKMVGAVSYEAGLKSLWENHFFILPTLGENFGYVILEALSAGCPVVISDRTIWTEVARQNAGWTIALDDLEKWNKTIGQCIDMNQDQFFSMSTKARQIGLDWVRSPDLELATENMLTEVVGA